jgi:hypothetical protein
MFKYLGFLCLILSSQANASLVTLESMDISRSFEYSDTLKTYWNNNAFDINAPDVLEVDTFENIRTGGHSLNLLSIEFDLASDTLFSVFAGLDAHYGAEIYVDNELVHSVYANLWWSKNWNHRSVVTLENRLLSTGQKLVEIFWAESCCNGPNSVMFSINNKDAMFLSASSLGLATTEVSAPSNFALMGLGLITVIGLSRRRKTNQ